jgi:hypothetical protein
MRSFLLKKNGFDAISCFALFYTFPLRNFIRVCSPPLPLHERKTYLRPSKQLLKNDQQKKYPGKSDADPLHNGRS